MPHTRLARDGRSGTHHTIVTGWSSELCTVAELRNVAHQGNTTLAHMVQAIVICALAAAVVWFTTPDARARSFVISVAFSGLEAGLYAKSGRGLFTTIDQFFANVVFFSMIGDAWYGWSGNSGTSWLPWWAVPLGRFVLCPVFIWGLEIVQNYSLMLLFGRNTAWCYVGWRTCCHGALEVSMYTHWWLVGALLEMLFPRVITVELGARLAPSIDATIAGVAAMAALVVLLGGRLPRCPAAPSVWPRAQDQLRGLALFDYRRFRIVEVLRQDSDAKPFDFDNLLLATKS